MVTLFRSMRPVAGPKHGRNALIKNVGIFSKQTHMSKANLRPPRDMKSCVPASIQPSDIRTCLDVAFKIAVLNGALKGLSMLYSENYVGYRGKPLALRDEITNATNMRS